MRARVLTVVAVLALAVGCNGDAEPEGEAPDPGEDADAAVPREGEPPEGEELPGEGGPPVTLEETEEGLEVGEPVEPDAGDPGPDDPAGEPDAEAPPERSVEIVEPEHGATVADPFTLRVAVDGFELREIDGSFEEDTGHLYAFVNAEPPAGQERLVEDTAVVRFHETEVEISQLQPGENEIVVIGSHGYPVPFEPRVEDRVTVVVEE